MIFNNMNSYIINIYINICNIDILF
ncbi:hypothetical protein [Plasmodium yoelii yoelii]|uniref:Uncharacterized protein n=1 Tax=Plasmodium yoelii yoelii TaxID=73239 RepID=Q7RSP3_PLAYO|nr:hypothetical protein [Plasmodium yoelii yoelii]